MTDPVASTTLLPEEGFGSFVWRQAAREGVTPYMLLRQAGVVEGARVAMPHLRLHTLHALLTPEQRAQVARAFDLSDAQVDAALLTRYADVAFDGALLGETRFDALHSAFREQWVQLGAMRYCPHCVAETGAWQVPWHLAFSVVCPKHAVILQPVCPSCQQPTCGGAVTTHARRTLDVVPDVRRCPNVVRGGAGVACGGDVTAAPVTAAVMTGPLLIAQRRVNQLLRDLPPGYSTLAVFEALRQVCQLMLGAGDFSAELGPLPEQAALAFQTHVALRDDEYLRVKRHASRLADDRRAQRYLLSLPPPSPLLLAALLPRAVDVVLNHSVTQQLDFVRSVLDRHFFFRGTWSEWATTVLRRPADSA